MTALGLEAVPFQHHVAVNGLFTMIQGGGNVWKDLYWGSVPCMRAKYLVSYFNLDQQNCRLLVFVL